MAGYFNRLRKKPKHVRDNIAFSAAGGITVFVAIVWFVTGFESPIVSDAGAPIQEAESPAFSTLINQIQEQVASVREGAAPQDNVSVATTTPQATGEWGLSAERQSSSTRLLPRQAAIMVIPSASSSEFEAVASSTNVLY